MGNASIKSGVVGFPQGADDVHAARPKYNPFEQKQHGSNKPGAGGHLSGTKAGGQGSGLQQGAAAGTSALSAGALAQHGSQIQPADSSYITAGRPPQINLQRQESEAPPDSGRSFPLAGGVAHQTPQTSTSTSAREPGTDREAGLPEGAGREGRAGAAAAATSVVPQNNGRIEADLQGQTIDQSTPEHHYGRDVAVGRGFGAAGVGAYEASKRHQAQTSQSTGQSANPEALAAARAAASEHDWTHEHVGHGHQYEGDPCDTHQEKTPAERGLLFTSGPHATDTANRTDPKLHIPGEFPSPTPIEESNASSYIQSKPTTETTSSAFGEPELRHTGSLDAPQARSVGPPSTEHHYGRDATIAGGLGAAGVGAYAAGKHHEKESAEVGSEIFPDEPNPYTHTKVDPRVDTTPRGGVSEQRYDPTVSGKRSPSNAALVGGATGTAQPSTQEISNGGGLSNKENSLAGQNVESDPQHRYGRDAALVGAGAATTAGLYASQRDAEPDSGPATSTIGPHKSNVANVLDPRVQPDPELQKHHHAAPTVEDPAPSTVGPHKSDVANIVDPRVLPDPQKQKSVPKEEAHEQQHHYGRDAAVAGGAGAAGYGAYEVAKSYGEHPSTQPSASLHDQRYDPLVAGAHVPGSTSATTASATSPQDQQHHYGRDAAVVGGLGTAGAGAYAANRDHQLEHTRAIPGGHSLDEQRYDPSASTHQANAPRSQHHYGRDAAVIGGAGALGAGAYAATRDHSQPQQPFAAQGYQESSTAQGLQQTNASPQQISAPPGQHHYGRDAAVLGGVGALGAGAYAATRDHPQPQQLSAAQGYQQPSTAPYSQNQSQTGAYPHDPSQKEDHTKRNAALGTGTVAAAGAGAYGLSQHDAQKEQQRQLKEQQKSLDEHQKALEKTAAADQKHHNKLVAATEKKHAKEAEHKEREHAKELDKREKEREAAAASTTFMVPQGEREYRDGSPEDGSSGSPHGKEKKHRIFTFLNKKDKDTSRSSGGETSPRGSRDSPRHSKEYAGAGAAGFASADHDSEGRHLAEKKGRHVLHKEPPKDHPAYETHKHEPVGKREHIGTDGPIGDPNIVSGD